MTKQQRRTEQLEAHYRSLERLAARCGVANPNGKKLSVALLKLEREAHQAAEDYCNGVRFQESEEAWDNFTESIKEEVQALFKQNLDGFFVNGDPRGYALKIQTEQMKAYETIRLHQDWGGYGILSPEITGN